MAQIRQVSEARTTWRAIAPVPAPDKVFLAAFPQTSTRCVGIRDCVCFDWEMASPGRSSWDLATALRYWSPLRNPANKKPAELLLDPMQRGEAAYEEWAAKGGIRRIELDEAWLGEESERLLQRWNLE